MRTALITVGDKQQVVLQPENKREHRILQMLLDGNNEVQVKDSELEVTEYGSLVPKPQPTYYEQYKDRPTPVIIQVQPEAPMEKPVRNPEVLVMTKGELAAILRKAHARTMGIDPFDPHLGEKVLEMAEQEKGRLLIALEELRAMGGNSPEPDPYL